MSQVQAGDELPSQPVAHAAAAGEPAASPADHATHPLEGLGSSRLTYTADVLPLLRRYGSLAALVILIIMTQLANSNFLSAGNIRLQLQTFCLSTALIGVGQTLVILTGGIDLSVGALLAVGSCLAGELIIQGAPIPVAFAVPIALTTVLGACSGAIIAKTRIQPIVVTLAMMIGSRGLAQLITSSTGLDLTSYETFGNLATTQLGPVPVLGLIPVSVVLTLVVYVVAWFFLSHTATGRYVFAIGGNERAARFSGVASDPIKIAVYATSGLLAGLAGVLYASFNQTAEPLTDGLQFELTTIAAVVVGGTSLLGGVGGVWRSLVGGMLLVVLYALFIQLGLPPQVQLIAQGLIIAGAVILQGGAESEKGSTAQVATAPVGDHGLAVTPQSLGLRAVSILTREISATLLVLLLLVCSLLSPDFLSRTNLQNLADQVPVFGVLAAAQLLVILSGGIDLSVGSVVALGAFFAAVMSFHGVVPAIVVPIVVAGLIGLINGIGVAFTRVPPFIITLAMLSVARGASLQAAVTYHGGSVTGTGSLPVSATSGCCFQRISEGSVLGIPAGAVILAGVFAVLAYVLRYTRFGRHVFAVGGNEAAALLLGVRVRRVKVAIYVISGALAGLAGVLYASRQLSAPPTAAQGYELDSITAVVVGGTLLSGGVGTVRGTIMGLLIIRILPNIFNLRGLDPSWQDVTRGILLLAVVLLQLVLVPGSGGIGWLRARRGRPPPRM